MARAVRQTRGPEDPREGDDIVVSMGSLFEKLWFDRYSEKRYRQCGVARAVPQIVIKTGS